MRVASHTLTTAGAIPAPSRVRVAASGWWAPTGLFLLAASIRLWGLWWGAPDRVDLHPDEMQHVMSHALAVSLSAPDPQFLNYPSFLIYLIAAANGLATRLGFVTEPWQSYVIARTIVAAFGALTVPATFWLATGLGAGALGAGLAGLWVAILPLHVWESHFAVTDVVMSFWIVVALALSVRLLREGRVLDYAVTGAAIGFGVASKYTAAIVGAAPLAALLLTWPGATPALRRLTALGAVALLAAFVGTPFTFLHFGQFREAMAFEYAHVHGSHYGFSLPALGWQYHKYVYELCAGFPFSMGFVLYASAAVGTLWTLRHLRRELLVVLAFAVPFFAVLGYWTFKPLRYQMPIVLIGAMLAGIWKGDWLEKASSGRRAIGALALAGTLVYTLIFTIETTERLRHDTRIEAGRWLDQTLEPGQRLFLSGLSSYFAFPTDHRIRVRIGSEGFVGKPLSGRPFDLVEISSLLYLRHERHGNEAHLYAYRAFRAGERGYHLVKRFDADFLNRDLYRRLDPMFASYFISPTLEFYAPDGAEQHRG